MFAHNLQTFPDLVEVASSYGRIYRTPEGNEYPSVTTVLGKLPKPWLEEWRSRVGDAEADRVIRIASRRGTALHKVAEDYLGNVETWKRRVSPDVLNMFLSIKPFLDENVDFVYGIEAPLYSDILRTAGRNDLFCSWAGVPSVIDFKNSRLNKEDDSLVSYFLQETTYAMMIEERLGVAVPQIVTLIACAEDHPQIVIRSNYEYRDSVKEIFKNHWEEYQASKS